MIRLNNGDLQRNPTSALTSMPGWFRTLKEGNKYFIHWRQLLSILLHFVSSMNQSVIGSTGNAVSIISAA